MRSVGTNIHAVRGRFLLVTIRVSSRARRVRQSPIKPVARIKPTNRTSPRSAGVIPTLKPRCREKALDSRAAGDILKLVEYTTDLSNTITQRASHAESDLRRIKGDLPLYESHGAAPVFRTEMWSSASSFGRSSRWSSRQRAGGKQLAPTGPLAAIMVLGPVVLFLRSRRTANLSPKSPDR